MKIGFLPMMWTSPTSPKRLIALTSSESALKARPIVVLSTVLFVISLSTPIAVAGGPPSWVPLSPKITVYLDCSSASYFYAEAYFYTSPSGNLKGFLTEPCNGVISGTANGFSLTKIVVRIYNASNSVLLSTTTCVSAPVSPCSTTAYTVTATAYK